MLSVSENNILNTVLVSRFQRQLSLQSYFLIRLGSLLFKVREDNSFISKMNNYLYHSPAWRSVRLQPLLPDRARQAAAEILLLQPEEEARQAAVRR